MNTFINPVMYDPFGTAKNIIKGRQDFSPKVRRILSFLGKQKIRKITIDRTPVGFFLKFLLNAASMGDFNKRYKNSPHDDLFHLRIIIETRKGKVALEKNEVINMENNPTIAKKAQTQEVDLGDKRNNININQLLDNTKKNMGKNFYPYSAKNNNCQDFILGIFNGNAIGTAANREFIKQDTKALFSNYLRKFSNVVTDIGASADVITQGSGVDKISTKDIQGMEKVSKQFENLQKDLLKLMDKHKVGSGIDFGKLAKKYGKAALSGQAQSTAMNDILRATGRKERIPIYDNVIADKIVGDGITDNIKRAGKKVAIKEAKKQLEKLDGKGIGKKTSSWIEHVKSVASKQGISYKDAMKVASQTYKK